MRPVRHYPILPENSTDTMSPFPSQAGGSTGLLMDLAANEKAVHADFFNGKDVGIENSSFNLNVSFVLYSGMLCDVTGVLERESPDVGHSRSSVQFI